MKYAATKNHEVAKFAKMSHVMRNVGIRVRSNWDKKNGDGTERMLT
jgi:hypothetical protein